MNLRLFVLMSLCTLSASISFSKDFGQKGNSREVIEQPFIKMIEERMSKVNIAVEYIKMQRRVRESIKNPQPVLGIKRANSRHSFLFDPTYILQEDIILPCGKLLHKAGAEVNPLEYMVFDRRLIFIDSTDGEQVKWLKLFLISVQDKAIENRVILINGSPLQLREEMQQDIYFDQSGILTQRFGIRAVPAVVWQEGKKLRVEELAI